MECNVGSHYGPGYFFYSTTMFQFYEYYVSGSVNFNKVEFKCGTIVVNNHHTGIGSVK